MRRITTTEEGAKEAMVEDPHWWHSIDNVRRATKVVQDELTRLEPAAKAEFAANAAEYGKELDALDAWVRGEIAKVPRNQRKLVTSHDAFQYFARAYGFTIHPIEGVTPEDQPSSRTVAELIATIKKEKVKAIFLESIENPKVAQEITKETGVKVGGTLYADGLGEGDAGTFVGMYRHNVGTIVKALK
jgi:zinc/manganese transport system substrate-binding protein